jgi:hypothetical protein
MSFVKLDDGHRPVSTEVFLDTSIHCCFHKGETLGLRLNWLLGLFSWKGSSTYSQTEYGNVILATAQYCLRKLRELQSVAGLMEHVNHVLTPQHHKYKTWTFSLIRTLGRSEEERTRRTDASLRRLLKFGTSAIAARCDTPLADGTKCHWGKTGLQRRRDGEYVWKTPNCKSSNRACNVDGFFVENRESFQAIKKEIDALDADLITDELAQFSQVIGEALENPTVLLDYGRGCKLLADAIIAVDGRDYRNFVTQNYKESQVLTKVFGQRCYYLPNNPEDGVQVFARDGEGPGESPGA